MVIRDNRQKLRHKDVQLLARDELFAKLSANVNDIFLMLDLRTKNMEYVSPNVQKILGISAAAVQKDMNALIEAESNENNRIQIDAIVKMKNGEQSISIRKARNRAFSMGSPFAVIYKGSASASSSCRIERRIGRRIRRSAQPSMRRKMPAEPRAPF